MKSFAAVFFSSVLLVIPAAAQHSGGSHSGGGHSSGGGHPGGSGYHGGGSVGGRGGYGGGHSGGRTVIVPYAYPAYGYGYLGNPTFGPGAFGSSYMDPGPGYSDAPAPESMDFGQPAPPPQEPDEQIPQPDNSGLQIYQTPVQTPQEQAMSEGRYYLIAYKDHSINTALAYWMENGVLNYVTPMNAHNQVTLDLLDLGYTKELNARRGLGFNLINR